jgi:hypothetical protein
MLCLQSIVLLTEHCAAHKSQEGALQDPITAFDGVLISSLICHTTLMAWTCQQCSCRHSASQPQRQPHLTPNGLLCKVDRLKLLKTNSSTERAKTICHGDTPVFPASLCMHESRDQSYMAAQGQHLPDLVRRAGCTSGTGKGGVALQRYSSLTHRKRIQHTQAGPIARLSSFLLASGCPAYAVLGALADCCPSYVPTTSDNRVVASIWVSNLLAPDNLEDEILQAVRHGVQ